MSKQDLPMVEEIHLDNLAIHAHSVSDDEPSNEELYETLKSFKRLPIPEQIDNSIVNISEDNLEDSAIVFSDSLPTSQSNTIIRQGEVNMLSIYVDEGELIISIDFGKEFFSGFDDILGEIVDRVDLYVTDFDAAYKIDRSFGDLTLEIEGPDGFDYKGIRFQCDDVDYILQSSSLGTGFAEERPSGVDESRENADERGVGKDETVRVGASTIEHFNMEESIEPVCDYKQKFEKALTKIVE